ncbi:dihydrofolate reductase [Carnimonas bestiolae]|uniref:dihydrofolate reductase n=1 Tax=Carnimonas bestiolae TaxID=3402172 RepID=UPI003EDC049A
MISRSDISIAIIVARSSNGVIGAEGKMPWHLPEDLRFFKDKTSHKPVIMGRTTFESIGRPLPNRTNIVITRNTSYRAEGVKVAHSLESALEVAREQAQLDGVDEVMIIGGGEIYAQALPLADRLYVTQIDITLQGDAFFASIDEQQWQLSEEVEGEPGPGQPHYRFLYYQRVP